MASTDLAVGDNRVSFGLLRPGKGTVRGGEVEVQTFFLSEGDSSTPRQSVQAEFREWPGGAGGAYAASLRFDHAGEWGLRIETRLPDGSSLLGGSRVDVKQTSSTPPIGSAAPRSANRTADDVDDLADLTTDTAPDPDLYRKTIAAALDERMPLLVSFATPAYCRTATCGPQLGVVKRLKDSYSERMNFIHVEVYDNLAEIRERGIGAARLTPVLDEWGLPSEPWTFVIDGAGDVSAKFEGFVNEDELTSAIAQALRP